MFENFSDTQLSTVGVILNVFFWLIPVVLVASFILLKLANYKDSPKLRHFGMAGFALIAVFVVVFIIALRPYQKENYSRLMDKTYFSTNSFIDIEDYTNSIRTEFDNIVSEGKAKNDEIIEQLRSQIAEAIEQQNSSNSSMVD